MKVVFLDETIFKGSHKHGYVASLLSLAALNQSLKKLSSEFNESNQSQKSEQCTGSQITASRFNWDSLFVVPRTLKYIQLRSNGWITVSQYPSPDVAGFSKTLNEGQWQRLNRNGDARQKVFCVLWWQKNFWRESTNLWEFLPSKAKGTGVI